MQRHGGVEIGLGRPHLNRHADQLDQFAGVGADDVATGHAVGAAVYDQFHEYPGIASGQRRLHRAEAGLVDVDFGQPRARLRLGQADDAKFGFGEHRGRYIAVIDLGRLAAIDRVGESMPLADRDRREIDPVGDIADGVDVGD